MNPISLPRSRARLALLAGAGALALYLPTWSPFVTWSHFGEDGPELEGAVRTLGIPHPTGYPLFVLLGRIVASVLPTPWSAVNVLTLLAAIAGVVSAAMVAWTLAERSSPGTDPRPASLSAAAFLAVSPLVWGQASIGEVYTLHLALLAGALVLLVSGASGLLIAYGLGLMLAHHGQSLVFLPVALLYLALHRRLCPRPAHAFAFLAPLSLYAVLLIRSRLDPVFDWGDPETVPGLLWEATGAPYRANLVRAGWLAAFSDGVFGALHLPARELGWGGAALAVLGFGVLARRSVREAIPLGLLYAGTVAVAALYDIPDPAAYLLPAVLVLALGAGVGTGWLVARLSHIPLTGGARAAGRGAVWGFLAALVAVRVATGLPFGREARDPTAWEYAAFAEAALPSGALVIAHGDGRTFSLWYGTRVLSGSRDVAVVYDTLLDWAWYRNTTAAHHPWLRLPPPGLERSRRRAFLIERHLAGRPVFLTEADAEAASRYSLRPAGPLLRVRPKGVIARASSGRRDTTPAHPGG